MNAFPRKRVEICGHCSHKRFTLARFHLGDPALVKQNTAEHLNAERALAEDTVGSLADSGKSLRQQRFERFAVFEAFAERRRHRTQLVLAHCLEFFAERIDGIRCALYFFKLSLAVIAEQ